MKSRTMPSLNQRENGAAIVADISQIVGRSSRRMDMVQRICKRFEVGRKVTRYVHSFSFFLLFHLRFPS